MKEWIERHPYLTGALALLIIVLYFLFRRSSTSTTSTTSGTIYAGPSDQVQVAALQAGTYTNLAALQSQTQIAGYQAAVQATGLQTAAAQNVYDYATAAQLQTQLATLGLSPSSSPFGVTMPIAGLTGGVQNPLLLLTGGYGQSQATEATTASNENAVGSSAVASSTPVTVAATTPTSTTNTYGSTDYASYMTACEGGVNTPCSPFDPTCIAQQNLVTQRCNAQYVSDPNSPHNLVPGSAPITSTPATTTTVVSTSIARRSTATGRLAPSNTMLSSAATATPVLRAISFGPVGGNFSQGAADLAAQNESTVESNNSTTDNPAPTNTMPISVRVPLPGRRGALVAMR